MRTECEIRSTSTHTAVACDQSAGIHVLIFIIVDKFGAFSAILDKENSKIFRGNLPPNPLRKRSHRGSSCLRHSLGQNGENVLISDFQMLAKYEIIECIKFVADMQQADNLASLKF